MSNDRPDKKSTSPNTGRKASPLTQTNPKTGPRTFSELKEVLKDYRKNLATGPREYIGVSFCGKKISPNSLKAMFKESMFFYESVLAQENATEASEDGSFVECFCYIPEITGMLPWPDYNIIKYAFSDSDAASDWNKVVQADNKKREASRRLKEAIRSKNAELERVEQAARRTRASKGIQEKPDTDEDAIRLGTIFVDDGPMDVSSPLKAAYKSSDIVPDSQIESEINKITMYPRFYKYTADGPPPIFQPVKVKFVDGMPSKFAGILLQSTGTPWIPASE